MKFNLGLIVMSFLCLLFIMNSKNLNAFSTKEIQYNKYNDYTSIYSSDLNESCYITQDSTDIDSSDIEDVSVCFEENGGSSVADQIVNTGETIQEPSEPTKDGYAFASWYSDSDFTEKYDFDTEVSKDITLYAKWVKIVNKNIEVSNITGLSELLSSEELENLNSIKVSKKSISASSLTTYERNLIKTAVSDKGTIAYYLNISITAIESSGEYVELTDLTDEATINLTLDSDYLGYSNYGIAQYYNGKANIIDSTYESTDYTITFDSSEFSTYAVYYAAEIEYYSGTKSYAIYIIAAFSIVSTLGVAYYFSNRKEKNRI